MILINKMNENDKLAYDYIINKDIENLKKCKFYPRILIEELKNKVEDLEFLLKYLKYDPGAGSYFYTDIKDNKTFDLYKKYKIKPCNLYAENVTSEQWDYLYKIKYINKKQYTNGSD
jgi:hypothetical protein